MRNVLKLKFALASLLLLSVISCTRADDSDKARLEIAIPKSFTSNKLGKLVDEKIAHVVVNVSGPGIGEPILWNWDIHEHGDGSGSVSVEAPVAVLNVPRGDSRTVQVLAVYQTSVGMSFYYGDSTKSLTNANETVAVNVSAIGSGRILSGRLNGRYLTSADAGPTGRVMMRYYPPNGRPSIVIDKSVITNGWFSFMMLYADSSVKFGYEVVSDFEPPRLLWGHPVNLADAEFNPNLASNRILKVAIPAAFRGEYGPNNAMTYKLEDAMVYGYGWFFDPANSTLVANKSICRPSALTALSRYSVNSSGTPSLPGQILTAADSFPSISDLSAQPNIVGGYKVAGGVDDPSCTGNYVDKVNLLTLSTMIDGNGQDGSMYNYPPVKAQLNGSSRSQVASSKVDATTYRFTGEFLPGVGANLIDGLSVYKRVSNVSLEWQNESMPCNNIEMNKAYGFTKVANISRSGDQFQVDVQVAADEGATGTTLAFCYKRQAMVLDAGFFVREWTFRQMGPGPGGGGGGSAPVVGFKLTGSSLVNSQIDFTPPLPVDPKTFAYEHLTNGYHMLFPVLNQMGQNSYFTSFGDLTVEVRKMVASNWGAYQAVTLNPYQTMSGGSSDRLGFMPASILSASDQKFQMKVTVTESYKTSHGLATNIFESPEYTLVSGCNSQPSLTARRVSPSAADFTGANLLSDLFTADTDFEASYRLVDTTNPTCETAEILVDYITQNMNSPCWDNMNVRRDEMDPFRVVVSPRDRGTCAISSGNISLIMPSNAGAGNVSRSGNLGTLNHSSVFAKVGAYLTDDGTVASTPINYLRLKLNSFIAGPLAPFDFKFLALNADEQVTDPATAAGFSSATNFDAANPGVFFSFANAYPTNVNQFTATTASSPGPQTAQNILFNGGAGKNGGITALVSNFSGDIKAISRRAFAGGSPLFAVSSGTGFDIKHVNSQYGNYVGQSMQTFMTTGTATTVRVESLGTVNMGEAFVVMTENEFDYCVYSYMSSSTLCDSTLGTFLGGGVQFKDFFVNDMNGPVQLFLVWVTSGPTYNVAWLNLKTFDSTTNAITGSYSFNGSQGTINMSSQNYLGLVSDSGVANIVGRSSANYFSYIDLPPSTGWAGGSLFWSTTGALISASFDRVQVTVDNNNNYPRRAFMFWSSSVPMATTYPAIVMIDSSVNFCQGANYVSNTLTMTASDFSMDAGTDTSAPLLAVAGGSSSIMGVGFYLAYPKTGTKTGFQFWSFYCNGGVLTIGSNTGAYRLGGLPNTNINGMAFTMDYGMGSTGAMLNIYGNNHVFYGTEVK